MAAKSQGCIQGSLQLPLLTDAQALELAITAPAFAYIGVKVEHDTGKLLQAGTFVYPGIKFTFMNTIAVGSYWMLKNTRNEGRVTVLGFESGDVLVKKWNSPYSIFFIDATAFLAGYEPNS